MQNQLPVEGQMVAKMSASFKNIEIQLVKAKVSLNDYDYTKKILQFLKTLANMQNLSLNLKITKSKLI